MTHHRQPPYISGAVHIAQVTRGKGDEVTVKIRSSHATRCPPMDLEVEGARKTRPVQPPQQVAIYVEPFNERCPAPKTMLCTGLLKSEAWTRHRARGPAFTYEATIVCAVTELAGEDDAQLELLVRWWLHREAADLVVRFPAEDAADDLAAEANADAPDDGGAMWLEPEARNWVVMRCNANPEEQAPEPAAPPRPSG